MSVSDFLTFGLLIVALISLIVEIIHLLLKK